MTRVSHISNGDSLVSDWECEHHTHLAKIGSMLIVCDEMIGSQITLALLVGQTSGSSLWERGHVRVWSFVVWAVQVYIVARPFSLGGCLEHLLLVVGQAFDLPSCWVSRP